VEGEALYLSVQINGLAELCLVQTLRAMH